MIVDLAAETGGNCELTRRGETFETGNGVVVAGPVDLASMGALHASEMFAASTTSSRCCCARTAWFDWDDELLAKTVWPERGGAGLTPRQSAGSQGGCASTQALRSAAVIVFQRSSIALRSASAGHGCDRTGPAPGVAARRHVVPAAHAVACVLALSGVIDCQRRACSSMCWRFSAGWRSSAGAPAPAAVPAAAR